MENLKAAQIEHKKELSANHQEIKDLKIQVDELTNALEWVEGPEIKTFENGHYTIPVRECCMQLITEGNVSLKKVPLVIRSVLSNLAGKLPSRVPSPALLSSQIMLEACYVATRKQTSE